jgi:hypothetical protein
MRHNPVTDPMVILGYSGFAIRCLARRQPDGTFRPAVSVQDCSSRDGWTLFESSFEMSFAEPDAAIEWALEQGRQIVGIHLEEECERRRWRA